MNDHELDRVLMRANPYGDETVRQLAADDAVSDLLEDIISTDTPTPKLRRSVRRRTVVLAAAAAAVAVALTGVFFPRGNPAAPVSAYGAEFRAVTDATPRLLLDDPAWKLTDVPVFTADDGEIKFGRGKQELQVNWRPAKQYADYLRGTQDPGRPSRGMSIELLGQTGMVYETGKPTDLTTILPATGRYFLTIRADVGSQAAYRSLVAKLKTVDTDTWLDAMPDTIVKQSDAPRVIDEMLADVPVPNSFDRTPFLKILVLARYQFGAKLTGAVSCGWLAQWNAAKKAGDAEKMQEAVTALAGSRSWKILQEMDKQGGWSYWIWAGGDALRKGDMVRVEQTLDCRN
ncbi:hypothetical protein Kfla_4159 [Kribbella flavida DSM 17836]|uniref:Uncharacterized protein n=1 Tax=Kribbella flavida (strain DSM 17836 / JCM 10339 / NBRC 14399) TaxID=479435 RepID=D2PTS3_KRIFD|nr:hypothetical protein [Kribbella flavida]ADB33206.1 hypothetical protein Kfla_4159 [Kribbella flavida DSM 17836]